MHLGIDPQMASLAARLDMRLNRAQRITVAEVRYSQNNSSSRIESLGAVRLDTATGLWVGWMKVALAGALATRVGPAKANLVAKDFPADGIFLLVPGHSSLLQLRLDAAYFRPQLFHPVGKIGVCRLLFFQCLELFPSLYKRINLY